MQRGFLPACTAAWLSGGLVVQAEPPALAAPAQAGASATAEPGASCDPDCVSASDYDWHVGLNVRTDFGTHPIRIDGGIRLHAVDLILVLDPMFWTDGQHDIDLILDGQLGGGWSLFGGWRSTSIGLADGRQFQQKSILGGAARLPALLDGHLRGQAGLELAILWVKVGGGFTTEGISFASARDFLDHFNFGLFGRFEYAAPF